jgi:GrpB-like predicted nucleotidyltransferase (UPF0157 family)
MPLSPEELGQLYPIILEDYNPLWPQYFIKEKNYLLQKLGNSLTGRIEHIGSTAIPNIKSKPTIDILVEISDADNIKNKINIILIKHNYIKMEEQKNHLMFVKGYSPTGLEKKSFHIHMGPKTQNWLWDRLYFRDYLIKNPRIAKEYEELKVRLSMSYRNDREKYTKSKENFILRITKIAKERLQ